MKKSIFIGIMLFSCCFINAAMAQSVAISNGTVITCNSVNAVYVSGVLEGRKGVPITGYTVDLIYGTSSKSVRIVTNAISNGGRFEYIGMVPENTSIEAPYQVKVTTNRQVSGTISATSCD